MPVHLRTGPISTNIRASAETASIVPGLGDAIDVGLCGDSLRTVNVGGTLVDCGSALLPVVTSAAIRAGWGWLKSVFKGPVDEIATNQFDELAEASGALRDAARGKGNYGIGSATSAEADILGEAWVGPNYTVASDGSTLVSADGLRQYRPPSYKPQLGKYQANFEQRYIDSGAWQSNAHLDITDLTVNQAP